MCGILGWVAQKGITSQEMEAFRKVLSASKSRGSQAAGVASQSLSFAKMPGEPDVLIKSDQYREWEDGAFGQKWIIGHTRHSTQGNPSINSNNHPLPVTVGGKTVAWVVHNGVVVTSMDTQKKAGLESGKFFIEDTSKTDSVVIAQAIAASWVEDDLFESVKKAFSLFYGMAAIAVVTQHEMVLARRMNPIVIARFSDGTNGFASEFRYLQGAQTDTFKITSHIMMKDNYLSSVDSNGKIRTGDLPKVERPYAANYSFNWQDYDTTKTKQSNLVTPSGASKKDDDFIVEWDDHEDDEDFGRRRFCNTDKPLVETGEQGWFGEKQRHREAAFKAKREKQADDWVRDNVKEFYGIDLPKDAKYFKKK